MAATMSGRSKEVPHRGHSSVVTSPPAPGLVTPGRASSDSSPIGSVVVRRGDCGRGSRRWGRRDGRWRGVAATLRLRAHLPWPEANRLLR
uniref:Uncharacterized protein n=1 Tax=Oryza punctata TaxID=4537 RepID=A0A0E0K447_ORYPU